MIPKNEGLHWQAALADCPNCAEALKVRYAARSHSAPDRMPDLRRSQERWVLLLLIINFLWVLYFVDSVHALL